MTAQREWLEKDYYRVLGVAEKASAGEVTKSCRKLARKLPPAATPGAPSLDTPATAATPSTAELQYKRIFHQAPVRDESATAPEESAPLRQRSVSSIALDPSGTRGMMRRRKLSVSIQLAQQ